MAECSAGRPQSNEEIMMKKKAKKDEKKVPKKGK
jgi:hypothetical protein